MATFRSGVKILGQISKTQGRGGAPFRSRSCDRRTLLNIQKRQESAFIAQDSCEDSVKETQRSRSWLSIFSRNRSPDSATEDERVVKKEDESWFSYFSKKPVQANEKKVASKAINKNHEEHILKDNKGEKHVNRSVHNDVIRENVPSISKGAVYHLHKGANIMSPRSTVVQPLSREIALAYGRSGFHSIPSNSYTKDKITTLKKHAASTQQLMDVNYSSMVTHNPETSTSSLPYTASDMQNLIMMSLSKSSSGCANPHLFNNEIKRSSHKPTSPEKTNIIDFGSQNLQLHSNSKLKSKTSDIGAMKQKGNIKQKQVGPPQHKPPQSSPPYPDKTDYHKVLYSESSPILPVNNERQKKEREAFLKTKALISMTPVASTQSSKTSSGTKVSQSSSYSANNYDLQKVSPLKLNIKHKGKALDKFTNPYISEIKPKSQKSKYISDSPLIKQKSHPTQFVVHPSMIANSSIPLRLSSSTANASEKYSSAFEESKIYQNDIKGPITQLSSLINKIDATAESSHVPQNLRNKLTVIKKLDMDNILKHETLTQQEHFIGMNQATKMENDATNVSCEPQSNAEMQSSSSQETATKLNPKVIMEHSHTKQNDSKIVTADCSQEPNNVDSADTNTAEEIMLEKKHKFHDDLNENMKSKFGMHMPYFKNQNNILAFRKSKMNKMNKNESLSLNKQKDTAKPLVGTASPKLAKRKEDNVSEVCEAEVDKIHNSEISKASPRAAVEEEYSQQKTEVLSEISKSLDSKGITTSDDISNKSDKTVANECASSTNEMEKSESASEELPELTLQTDYGPNEDTDMHQQAPLEKPAPSVRKHRYFPNYFSKRSLSGYTDPPGEKLEISCCPGKEKDGGDKCKKKGAEEKKNTKCIKVSEPGCVKPKRSTLCTPPMPNDACNKRMPPAPSYSECIKAPLPPKVYGECNPIKDLECPGEKQRKEYDACKKKLVSNPCGSEKKNKPTDEETHKTDNTCPPDEPCPEPYKSQKTKGYSSGSPMKCQSRHFSNFLFPNDISKRFYSTSENENALLSLRNTSTVYPNPMLSVSSFYHKKVECKGGTCGEKSRTCKGKKEEKKSKKKCAKIHQDGCMIPKSTLCVPPTNFEKCNKVLAPKPSYSECMRSVEIPPRPFTECDPTVDLECPIKKRKNYDACRPTKKPDNLCPAPKTDKKAIQWKDNACPKEEECPTGKKASTGYSNEVIKCPSLNKTAAYLPSRRYFSSASNRDIFKCYSSPALDSSSLYDEEMIYSPFIVAQHMRNDSHQHSSHERNTQKGKPFVTLSASYCSSPIFLDYMAFKSSNKCKNYVALNKNFLQKIAPDSNKDKVAQCTNSKRPEDIREAAKGTGITGMEMERLSEEDIILKKYRLSKSYVPIPKYLTYSCLLHHTQQDMVSERAYCTWSTVKQSTRGAPQENIGSIRQYACKRKNGEPCPHTPKDEKDHNMVPCKKKDSLNEPCKGKIPPTDKCPVCPKDEKEPRTTPCKKKRTDSLNEPCVYEPKEEEKKEQKISAEKPFCDCPPPKKDRPCGCAPQKKMKVVAPPRVVKAPVLDCPKPPKKVQHKCEEEIPPPPPPPPPKPVETFAECPQPKPKPKPDRPCEEEPVVVEEPAVCRNKEPAPTFVQCPMPKCKEKRKCEQYEPPSESCKETKKPKSPLSEPCKKQKPECPPRPSKKKCPEANGEE